MENPISIPDNHLNGKPTPVTALLDDELVAELKDVVSRIRHHEAAIIDYQCNPDGPDELRCDFDLIRAQSVCDEIRARKLVRRAKKEAKL
jgi:hypothetical protein